MKRFKITFTDRRTEELEADSFSDSRDGKWIDFYRDSGMSTDRSTRFRSGDVTRIDEVSK